MKKARVSTSSWVLTLILCRTAARADGLETSPFPISAESANCIKNLVIQKLKKKGITVAPDSFSPFTVTAYVCTDPLFCGQGQPGTLQVWQPTASLRTIEGKEYLVNLDGALLSYTIQGANHNFTVTEAGLLPSTSITLRDADRVYDRPDDWESELTDLGNHRLVGMIGAKQIRKQCK